MQDQMQIDNWNNKVILETHINAYFYLQVALDRLDKNAKYIIIDKYPEMLKLYKGLIDSTDSNFNILLPMPVLIFPFEKIVWICLLIILAVMNINFPIIIG